MPDHREAIGGLWKEIGDLQFRFLLDRGLKPHHKLLDVGCGSLRGGIHFVTYLEGGNYYGMDQQQWLLDAGRNEELPAAGINGKNVHLECRGDFDFSVFGARFDFAIAQSVFTHLNWNQILRCLVNIQCVLESGGRFFATYFRATSPRQRIESILHDPGGVTTNPDSNPFHYEFDTFEELAARSGLCVENLGDWDHPRNQKIMVFEKA